MNFENNFKAKRHGEALPRSRICPCHSWLGSPSVLIYVPDEVTSQLFQSKTQFVRIEHSIESIDKAQIIIRQSTPSVPEAPTFGFSDYLRNCLGMYMIHRPGSRERSRLARQSPGRCSLVPDISFSATLSDRQLTGGAEKHSNQSSPVSVRKQDRIGRLLLKIQ